MSLSADSFRYRCDWRTRSSRPGVHRSALTGNGFEMRENALMRLGEDPRRIDLHRSARDPLQRLWVRRMQHTSTVKVSVLADVSGSMAAHTSHNKYRASLQFIQACVRSVSAHGDRFALHVADQQYLPELSLSARRLAILPAVLLQKLESYKPAGHSAEGLLVAAESIGHKRGIVFLLSDFYWPLELVEQLCQALWHVQLVPVMLGEKRDTAQQSRWLAVYRDAESGQQKLHLQLPWKPPVADAVARHQQAVQEIFSRHGRRVLLLEDGFDANLVSAYFYT